MTWAVIALAAVVLAHFAAHAAGWWQLISVAGLVTSVTFLAKTANAVARRRHHRWLQDVAFGAVCVGLGEAVLLLASLSPVPKGDAAAMLIAGTAAVVFGVAVTAPALVKGNRTLAMSPAGDTSGHEVLDPFPEPLISTDRTALMLTTALFVCSAAIVAWDAIAAH